MVFFIFLNFAATALSIPTFDIFRKRADGGCSFTFILYVVPLDAATTDYAIVSVSNNSGLG